MARACVKSIILFTTLLSGSLHLKAAQLLQGDPAAAAQESFSSPIAAHASSSTGQSFFVGAAPGSLLSEYALSSIDRHSTQFSPLAPQYATINNVFMLNPLYNNAITFLSLFETPGVVSGTIDHPIVVSDVEPKRIFVIENATDIKKIIMLVTGKLNDAAGLESCGIVGLVAANLRQGGSIAFAAVKDTNDTPFGTGNSGVAMASYIETKIKETTTDGKETERSLRLFGQIDAQSTVIAPPVSRAALFNKTSDFVKIGIDLADMTITDMCWSQYLNRLYVGLRVTGAGNVGDGARSIAVGRLVYTETQDDHGNKTTRISLVFEPIVDTNVFVQDAADEIIGAIEADAAINAHKIRVMHTSTRLNYLVVLGGNVDAPDTTATTLFALPLVCDTDSSAKQGTLAHKNAIPEDIFLGQDQIFVGRLLKTPATANADILKANDTAARVGGGPVPAGNVTDIFVQSDAVFVAVGDADANQLPGLFVSTALFDELGRIKGWTQWQRVAGTTEQTFSGAFDPEQGSYLFLSGDAANNLKTVQRTVWTGSTGDDVTPLQGLISLLSQELRAQDAGIHALFDFPSNTPGLGPISWMTATGLRKLVLVETGRTTAGTFTPNTGDFSTDLVRETTGGITAAIPNTCKVVVLTGGALDTIGAITSAEVADGGVDKKFLVIGGVNGLAILTNDASNGWNAMDNGFSGLAQGMQFRMIGNYSFVRKLISSQNYVYVLTDTELDRIDLAASNFVTGALTIARLASKNAFSGQGHFLDMLISEKLALLATSKGVVRSGNGVNVADPLITTQDAVKWTAVVLPQALLPVSYFYPLATSLLSKDVAAAPSGMAYLISGDIGNNRARLMRISIADVSGVNAVDNSTVQPLNDLFVKNSPSYLANLSGFRNLVSTDGSIRLVTVDRDLTTAPSAVVLMPSLATGLGAVLANSTVVPLNFSHAGDIVACLRTSALGSWVMAGDFGVVVNE
ncbi:hypothetical protein KJZ61_00195 [Candidatus Dependentiae bacterium]|nr:hypothetical protein [Candidatus Dependentiae bacterium]